jgi:hypothetical protein
VSTTAITDLVAHPHQRTCSTSHGLKFAVRTPISATQSPKS